MYIHPAFVLHLLNQVAHYNDKRKSTCSFLHPQNHMAGGDQVMCNPISSTCNFLDLKQEE